MAHTSAHGATGANGAHGAPKLNHEPTDIELTGATRAGLLSLGVIAVTMLVVYGAWGLLISYAQRNDPGRPPMAVEDYGQRVPPTPRLQTVQGGDLAAYRAAQTARLTSFGWVDQAAGTVHVPIDVAMQLVVQRASEFATAGATAPAPPAAAPAAPSTPPAAPAAAPGSTGH